MPSGEQPILATSDRVLRPQAAQGEGFGPDRRWWISDGGLMCSSSTGNGVLDGDYWGRMGNGLVLNSFDSAG